MKFLLLKIERNLTLWGNHKTIFLPGHKKLKSIEKHVQYDHYQCYKEFFEAKKFSKSNKNGLVMLLSKVCKYLKTDLSSEFQV